MNIYDELAFEFSTRAYMWRFDGDDLRVPTAEEIEAAVDIAVRDLYDENEGSILEFGRLIVQKGPDKTYDIFLHIGETK